MRSGAERISIVRGKVGREGGEFALHEQCRLKLDLLLPLHIVGHFAPKNIPQLSRPFSRALPDYKPRRDATCLAVLAFLRRLLMCYDVMGCRIKWYESTCQHQSFVSSVRESIGRFNYLWKAHDILRGYGKGKPYHTVSKDYLHRVRKKTFSRNSEQTVFPATTFTLLFPPVSKLEILTVDKYITAIRNRAEHFTINASSNSAIDVIYNYRLKVYSAVIRITSYTHWY